MTLSDVVVGDVWIVAGDAFGPAVRKAGYDTKPLAQEALAHPEIRVVPGGVHNEASWEHQIPFFMDVLFYNLP